MIGDRFTVLATDEVSAAALEPLRSDDRFEVVHVDDSSDSAFGAALTGAHGLIVRSATTVRGELLAAAPGSSPAASQARRSQRR